MKCLDDNKGDGGQRQKLAMHTLDVQAVRRNPALRSTLKDRQKY